MPVTNSFSLCSYAGSTNGESSFWLSLVFIPCKQNCNGTNVSPLKKELLTTYYVYIIKFILSQKETLFLASS